MFFPLLEGIASPLKAPVLWLLFALNVFFYYQGYQQRDIQRMAVDKILDDKYFLQTQGMAFSQYLQKNQEEASRLKLSIAEIALRGGREHLELMGHLASRDPAFYENGADEEYKGDQVAFEYWREKFASLKKVQVEHPSQIWGLSAANFDVLRWISYQFMHGGFMHLAINMWFLLIFGSILEQELGATKFLALFLTSGIAGALSYVWLSGISLSPLIGASASVSGLMGFFAALFYEKRVRFLYWILPSKPYSGYIYIPTALALGFWLLSDLAGYLSTIPELGGVAHAAHLGGFIWGLTLGLFFRWSKTSSHRVLRYTTGLHEL